ncbi:MAG TPA: HAMP domain-containing sensor histidine kinase [Candidatus Goldiibacteriota bacterium]|nr:HAMP domain-containing sensor histidine kinase [Candidatus Goldiibacteriota bacterium]
MNTDEENLLLEYTKKNNLIFYFILDKQGNVKEHNKFASDFIKNGGEISHIKEVFVDFYGRIDIESLSKSPDTEHIISVNSFSGIPESFYFKFHRLNGDFIVFGRLDVMELELFHTKLIELNNEFSNISRELHKSNAELNKLHEMKNLFLGMAVHDLRKPITVIKGFSSLLLNGAADNDKEMRGEFIRHIAGACENMETLVNNFLDLSVIESGRLKLSKTKFSIKEEIHPMLMLNKMKADNLKIKLVIEADDLALIADKSKIQQVLDNLTANALEYTPKGGTVTVRAVQDNAMVLFTVDDEGPGIPEDKKNNLFKPFGRTGVIKANGEKSTGLGLVISKKITEEHGGSIGAQNREQKGARFWFKIPAA